MPPPASGYSGYSGYSGKSGFSGANPGASGYSGFSGKSGATGANGPAGASGISGYSGKDGGGMSGPITTDPAGNITTPGTITIGVNSGTTGDVAVAGRTSGIAHLSAWDNAGDGIFKLPPKTGTHTLATLTDLEILRQELIGLING